MSFTGVGPLFHTHRVMCSITPRDVLDEVTDPMLLNTVHLSIGKAIDVLMAKPPQ
jgi:hypothetical protein